MLHLRLIVPDDSLASVQGLLLAEPSVTNVIVVRDAALEPPGHLVLCDVARESASDVLSALERAGLPTQGSIALEAVDVSLSDAADSAERAAPGFGVDAVVWQEIEARTSEESALSLTFLSFMVIAALIAAVGIVTDSQIAIVGAMVVGPEFGPIAALCVATVRRSPRDAARPALALLVGFPASILSAALFTRLGVTIDIVPARFRSTDHPLTEFISEPSEFAVVVAFFAGVAGILSLTSAKSGALIGVLISVTTIPAAANVGVAMAVADWPEMRGAAAQLGVNLTALLLAGITTLALQRRLWDRARAEVALGADQN